MNAKDLLEYLTDLATQQDLIKIKVNVEGTGKLTIYDENHDGKLDTLYLIYK